MGTDGAEGVLPENSLEYIPERQSEDIQRRREWFDDQFQEYGLGEKFAPGGTWETGRMSIEVREAYAQGFYISTVILSFTVLERLLTYELLFEGELESHKREGVDKEVEPRIDKILSKSEEVGIIGGDEKDEIEALKEIRNSYVHYRHFNHSESRYGQWNRERESRELETNEEAKEDAQQAIATMMKVAGSAKSQIKQ